MTAFRLLGLGVLVAWVLVLGVELWAYGPDSSRSVAPHLALQRAELSTAYENQDSSMAEEERYGLRDRDVTPEPVGVNPLQAQPEAWQPLPLEPTRDVSDRSKATEVTTVRMRVRFTWYVDRGITRWGCQTAIGIAATDPAVIPPMSRFRIVGWPGEWLACDTGSLVRGSHIDAWQPSLEAGRAFIRQMGESGEIEILRWGP